jgi:hypothetical protein
MEIQTHAHNFALIASHEETKELLKEIFRIAETEDDMPYATRFAAWVEENRLLKPKEKISYNIRITDFFMKNMIGELVRHKKLNPKIREICKEASKYYTIREVIPELS